MGSSPFIQFQMSTLDDVLNSLYHASMHSACCLMTQTWIACHWMRHNHTCAEPPNMHADVSVNRCILGWDHASGGNHTCRQMVLKEVDGILR